MDKQESQMFEIRIKGTLNTSWQLWFEGMKITPINHNQTSIIGEVTDQSALFGILNKIRDLGLTLISINPVNHQTMSNRD